jgi:hypothetical protein
LPAFEPDPTAADAPPAQAFRLAAPDVAFIESGVSIIAAAQALDGSPAIARAIGARVDAERGRVRLYLRRQDAEALLVGAATHSLATAMFSRPSTTESIQVKGDGAAVETPTAEDDAARRRYLPAMIAELMPLGFDASYVCCLASDHGSPLAILSFAPRVVFDQTPGPRAGERRSA